MSGAAVAAAIREAHISPVNISMEIDNGVRHMRYDEADEFGFNVQTSPAVAQMTLTLFGDLNTMAELMNALQVRP